MAIQLLFHLFTFISSLKSSFDVLIIHFIQNSLKLEGTCWYYVEMLLFLGSTVVIIDFGIWLGWLSKRLLNNWMPFVRVTSTLEHVAPPFLILTVPYSIHSLYKIETFSNNVLFLFLSRLFQFRWKIWVVNVEVTRAEWSLGKNTLSSIHCPISHTNLSLEWFVQIFEIFWLGF